MWILWALLTSLVIVRVANYLWDIDLEDSVFPLILLIGLYVDGLADEEAMRPFWIAYSGYVVFLVMRYVKIYVIDRKRSVNRY